MLKDVSHTFLRQPLFFFSDRRVILKMAFVRESALMSDAMRSHVSHHNGSGNVGKKKKDRRKKKKNRYG